MRIKPIIDKPSLMGILIFIKLISKLANRFINKLFGDEVGRERGGGGR